MSPDNATGFRPSMRDALAACSPRSASAGEDRQDRCAYPSKPCPNARATKLNGDRHNFCELHRRKANMNQRRWQQRRRRMRRSGDSSPSTSARDEPHSPHANDEMESARAVMMLQQSPPGDRYSTVPTHAWPHYAPAPPTSEWAPHSHSPVSVAATLRHPYPQHEQYPVSYSRPSIEMPLSRGPPYTYAARPMPTIIPPLRSLPLPPLLPSALARAQTPSPPVASTRVYTC